MRLEDSDYDDPITARRQNGMLSDDGDDDDHKPLISVEVGNLLNGPADMQVEDWEDFPGGVMHDRDIRDVPREVTSMDEYTDDNSCYELSEDPDTGEYRRSSSHRRPKKISSMRIPSPPSRKVRKKPRRPLRWGMESTDEEEDRDQGDRFSFGSKRRSHTDGEVWGDGDRNDDYSGARSAQEHRSYNRSSGRRLRQLPPDSETSDYGELSEVPVHPILKHRFKPEAEYLP